MGMGDQSTPRRRPYEAPDVATASQVTIMPRMLTYDVANVQGIGRRDEQQDSFGSVNAMDALLMRDEGLFAVVADGMGGMAGGAEASSCAVRTMLQSFRERNPHQDMRGFLVESATAANRRVYEMFGAWGGSTLVACVLWQELLWYLSVGDSYLFLLRDGALTRINEEHNVRRDRAMELLAEDVFDPSLVDAVPDGSAITSFIGTEERLRIDGFAEPLPLRSDDVLLLCSDGIGDALDERTIARALACERVSDMCGELELAIEGLNDPLQDNYTGVVIKCAR